VPAAAEATATLAPVLPVDAGSAEGGLGPAALAGTLGLDRLAGAFVMGFSAALVVATAALVIQALRRTS
jgi:hypothetical protein